MIVGARHRRRAHTPPDDVKTLKNNVEACRPPAACIVLREHVLEQNIPREELPRFPRRDLDSTSMPSIHDVHSAANVASTVVAGDCHAPGHGDV